MAHFAELDRNNTVLRVIVVHNNELLDENKNESEEKGILFCKNLYGENTKWVQTSYNGNFRKRYAGIGFCYNESLDAFIEPQPFLSWILNEEDCNWQSPVPIPEDHLKGKFYNWNENELAWILDVNFPTF